MAKSHPENTSTLAWSCTRAQLFEDCRRKYWYQYHLAPRGRAPDDPDEARLAYFLKGLSGPEAWAGSIVHKVIERTLSEWRRSRAFTREEGLRLGFDILAREYQNSRAHCAGPEDEGAALVLEPHYFRGPDALTETYRDKVSYIVSGALRNFYEAPILDTIRRVGPKRWLEPERIAAAHLPGDDESGSILVYVRPDFVFWEEEQLRIIDWKTGDWKSHAPDRAKEEVQVLCYALYAQEKWGVPLEQTVPAIVRLYPEYQLESHAYDPHRTEVVRQYIRESHGNMVSLLPDPGLDWAPRENFPETEDVARCRWCVFRQQCPGGARATE